MWKEWATLEMLYITLRVKSRLWLSLTGKEGLPRIWSKQDPWLIQYLAAK